MNDKLVCIKVHDSEKGTHYDRIPRKVAEEIMAEDRRVNNPPKVTFTSKSRFRKFVKDHGFPHHRIPHMPGQ